MKNIIERKLAAGVLPDRPPVKYWAGFGVGQPCDGCDEPILDTQVEYEVAFDAFPTVRLHAVSAESYKGKRLAVHAVLVTCPACRELIAAARAMKEQGT